MSLDNMSLYNNTVEETTAQCLCCNVKLSHPNSIKEHFKSKKHHKKWAQYLGEGVVPWTSTVPVNGEANVGKSATPESRATTSTVNLLDIKTWPSLYFGSSNKTQLFPDNPSKSDQKAPDDLRAQIFTELEKLVQTLYYSKKLPEQVSLQYLKKINGEVKTLIEKHAKSDSVETSNASSKVVVPKDKTVADTSNKIETKEVKSQAVVKPPAAITDGSTKQINQTETKKVKSPQKEIKETALKQEPQVISKQDNSFSNLVTKILDEKHRLEKAGIQSNMKKLEVINEIMILLMQVNQRKLPLQNVLDCLKKFNEIVELDLDCMKQPVSQPCIGM